MRNLAWDISLFWGFKRSLWGLPIGGTVCVEENGVEEILALHMASCAEEGEEAEVFAPHEYRLRKRAAPRCRRNCFVSFVVEVWEHFRRETEGWWWGVVLVACDWGETDYGWNINSNRPKFAGPVYFFNYYFFSPLPIIFFIPWQIFLLFCFPPSPLGSAWDMWWAV